MKKKHTYLVTILTLFTLFIGYPMNHYVSAQETPQSLIEKLPQSSAVLPSLLLNQQEELEGIVIDLANFEPNAEGRYELVVMIPQELPVTFKEQPVKVNDSNYASTITPLDEHSLNIVIQAANPVSSIYYIEVRYTEPTVLADFGFEIAQYPIKVLSSSNQQTVDVIAIQRVSDIQFNTTAPEPDSEPNITTETVVEQEAVPYEVIYEEDASRPAGEEVVVQEGIDGLISRTIEVTYTDGVETNRQLISEDIQEATNQIISVGTLTTTTEEYTETEDIPFEVVKEDDATIPAGEEVVKQTGVNGVITRTYLITYQNGEEISRELISESQQDPVNEIISVGTLQQTTEERTEESDIPFETTTQEDASLPKGEEKIIQEGKNGKKSITYKETYQNGELVSSEVIAEVVTVEPVSQITAIGTNTVTTVKRTDIQEIPFETEERNNGELPQGEQREIQAGVNGERTIEYEDTIQDGAVIETVEISNTVTKEPVKRIVEIGTKQQPIVTTEEEVKEEIIPFTQSTKENADKPSDYKQVIQQGVDGKRILTYKVTYTDGSESNREVIKEEVIDPIEEITELGTQVVETKEEKVEEPIPFDVEKKENTELEKGKEQTTQEGINGVLLKTFTVTYTNGQETKRELKKEEKTKEPVNQIIEVGTKVPDESKPEEQRVETEVKVIPLDYRTERIEDKEMEKGTEKTVQSGMKGSKEVTYSVTYDANNQKVKEEKVGEKVTKEPVNEIIHFGTKVNSSVSVSSSKGVETKDKLPESGESSSLWIYILAGGALIGAAFLFLKNKPNNKEDE